MIRFETETVVSELQERVTWESVRDKYRDVGALLAYDGELFVIDRAIFDSIFRKSPARRYQVIDTSENVHYYARTVEKALSYLSNDLR